jgi:hypothetical protein
MAEHRVPQVSRQIAEANAAVRMQLPFEDTADFDDARRGLVGALSDGVIRGTDGRVVWDADAYGFLDGACPETVNPSLWRQGQLNAIHGKRDDRGDRDVRPPRRRGRRDQARRAVRPARGPRSGVPDRHAVSGLVAASSTGLR